MPFPFAFLAPVVGAIVSGAAAVGGAAAAGAAAVGTAAAAAGSAVAAGAAAVGGAAAAGAAAIGGAAAVTAAALGTSGMIVAGVATATAILVVVAVITIEEIRKRLAARKLELERQRRRVLSAKILKLYKSNDYSEVNIGLYDENQSLVDEMVMRGESLSSDVYEGQRISLIA